MQPNLDAWGTILQGLAGGSVTAGLLAIAVRYFKQSSDNLLVELNKERSARLDLLEGHIKECDIERRELRDRMSAMATRVTRVESHQQQ